MNVLGTSLRNDAARIVTFAAVAFALIATTLLVGSPRIAAASVGKATPLLLIAAIGFGVLVIRYSAAGAAVLVAFVYLNLSEALVRYHQFPSLLQMVVVALAFAAWLERDTEEPSIVLRQPLTLALLAYLLMVFLSTAWAGDRDIADKRLADLGKAFALYLLATLLMFNRRRLMQGVAALLGAACLLAVLALYQSAEGEPSHEFGGLARFKTAQIHGDVFQPRIAGPVGDPNFFAQMLLLALPLALTNGSALDSRWKGVALGFVAALLLLTLLLTYSRGAIVALAAMAVMVVRMVRIPWRSAAVGVGILLLTSLVIPSGTSERLSTIAEIFPATEAALSPDSSFKERRLLMGVAWAMFIDNPIVGVGIGNYTVHYDEYASVVGSSAKLYGEPSDPNFPHSLYLELAAETGIAGVAIFAAVLVLCWIALRDARVTFDAAGEKRLAAVATGLQIGLAGFLVAGIFLHLALPRYLFLLFAFAASIERLAYASRIKDSPDANDHEERWLPGTSRDHGIRP